jgi:hypothetical protein
MAGDDDDLLFLLLCFSVMRYPRLLCDEDVDIHRYHAKTSAIVLMGLPDPLFFANFRLSRPAVEYVLSVLGPHLRKKLGRAIATDDMTSLCLFLWFLGTGERVYHGYLMMQ